MDVHNGFPPPPPKTSNIDSDSDSSGLEFGNEDDDDDIVDLTKPKRVVSVKDFVAHPPSEEAYAREENGEEEPEPEEVPQPEPKEPVELTPAQKTFTPLCPIVLYMNPTPAQVDADGKPLSLPIRAKEAGVDIINPETKKIYTKEKLTQALRRHFIEVVHGGDEQSYAQSDCFKSALQDIDRKRKPSSVVKRKAALIDRAGGMVKPPPPKRSRKAAVPDPQIRFNYKHEPIEFTGKKVICRCNQYTLTGKSKYDIERHFKQPGHKAYVAKREKSGKMQASVHDFNKAKEDEEIARLSVVGTRVRKYSPEDLEFCEDVLKQFLMNGIAVAKLRGRLRKWIGRMAKKKLMNAQDLSAEFIPIILEKEETLQRTEHRDKKISIIYDATPRGGDTFGVVARKIDVDPKLRHAEATQTLIYTSTLKGSMNAVQLSAEVNTALAERQILNSDVPAAAMDACATNSASVNEMNQSSVVAGKIERLVAYCMSHLSCNAGKQVSFVLLELFWTYIQKIFAQSTAAQDEFTLATQTKWPTYSETRWFSKYDVVQVLSEKFDSL